jgi:hypothetical protein
VNVLRWDHRSTQADAIQGSPLDNPAENAPNHDHLLLVHHVNLSGLVAFDHAIRSLIAREPALTNLLELTTLRTLGYLRPLAGNGRPFS